MKEKTRYNVAEIYHRLAMNCFAIAIFAGMTVFSLVISHLIRGSVTMQSVGLIGLIVNIGILFIVVAKKSLTGDSRARVVLEFLSVVLLCVFPVGTILAWPVVHLRHAEE